MSQFHIATQDDLPAPDGDEPYVLFVNQAEYGNARFLCTNVLSARPDLKKYMALRFWQEVKRHADAAGPGEDVVLVFMEAEWLDIQLTLVCLREEPSQCGFCIAVERLLSAPPSAWQPLSPRAAPPETPCRPPPAGRQSGAGASADCR